jgi:hypothetical protein
MFCIREKSLDRADIWTPDRIPDSLFSLFRSSRLRPQPVKQLSSAKEHIYSEICHDRLLARLSKSFCTVIICHSPAQCSWPLTPTRGPQLSARSDSPLPSKVSEWAQLPREILRRQPFWYVFRKDPLRTAPETRISWLSTNCIINCLALPTELQHKLLTPYVLKTKYRHLAHLCFPI